MHEARGGLIPGFLVFLQSLDFMGCQELLEGTVSNLNDYFADDAVLALAVTRAI